jgi:hypothetical protein
LCPEGYYCDNTVSAVITRGVECPAGHYCPPSTKFATQFKCRPGTWSNKTKLVNADECFECPPR